MDSEEEMNSIWLFDVLNITAVNFRKASQQLSITTEIITTYSAKNKSFYMVGSTFEGTRLPGKLLYNGNKVTEDQNDQRINDFYSS